MTASTSSDLDSETLVEYDIEDVETGAESSCAGENTKLIGCVKSTSIFAMIFIWHFQVPYLQSFSYFSIQEVSKL